ncbi:hypothetical protein JOD54_006137 [Actinokineospora baliensis]|uniref:hypothetical protein n=1 Tax=Actinokineospora baliensis TaxID=547056 RepID=UPI00195C6F43|nr:hypothetical protein [Actinokineospora baliensis]MBM7775933.1 hypothetical protein [Actinokineospora baliensis]
MADESGRVGDELEDALVHAERALDALDRVTSRMQVVRLTIVGVFAITATVAVLNVREPFVGILVAMIGIGAIAALVMEHGRWRSTRDRELRTVVQLSRIVRDLLPVVVEQERWSELRIVTTRARIARFPISERSR